jgi:hypothetical protein
VFERFITTEAGPQSEENQGGRKNEELKLQISNLKFKI